MTSRERMLTALSHKEPDRVPLDIGQSSFTGISVIAYRNLLDYLGKKGREIIVHDRKQQLARMDEDILLELGVDARGVYFDPPKSWQIQIDEIDNYFSYTDHWNITWRMPKDGGLYYDLWKSPLDGSDLLGSLKDFRWPDPKDDTRITALVEKSKKLRAEDEFFVMVGGCAMTVGYFQEFQWLQGIAESYMNLACDKKGSQALLDKMEELELTFWEWFLPKAGHNLDMMVIPDDFAGQSGLLISKAMFRKYFKPMYVRLFSTIRRVAPHMKIFYHCCGAATELIPDFIEMGADILNPLQLSAKDINIKEIKRNFGKDICFWGGGIDTQFTLPSGTPQQVRDEVKRNIEILAPGGGFVFNTVHCIQADVPPQNIVAMLEALNEFGEY